MKKLTLRRNILRLLFGLLAPGAIAAGLDQASPLAALCASDWASIRAAHQAHRHDVIAAGEGYRMRNPGQQWRTDFDRRGAMTAPDGGGWQWGLELRSYGIPGKKRALGAQAALVGSANRVIYRRDPDLCEWFVNDKRGLEHGFTVGQAPAGALQAGAELEFDFAVRGNLHPEIAPDGRSLRFLDEQDVMKLTYSGLKAWDAEGKELPARFVAQPGSVRLLVETGGAHYPITIDPLAQQAYLKASNTERVDLFGRSIAISGDTVVVGAPREASNATGINGNQNDNTAPDSGAAYVFVRNGASWSQEAYLKASNTESNDDFGLSVAISGDTIVVGAHSEASNATGIDGDQNDNSADASGAAYVFVRAVTTWSQQAYLKASNTGSNDNFGISVAISGDTIVVGADGEASNATGICGDQNDNTAPDSGAAYVFVRNATTWIQDAYLKASNTETGNLFGVEVAIAGDSVVVGASHESSNATGINGDQTDNSASFSGAAYVFVRNAITWSQEAYLKASNTETSDLFGISVAISGDTIVVGASFEDSNATGINGDQTDNSALESGAAYVFVRNATTWSQEAYLKASNTESDDDFGASVAISGDTVVVGAEGEASNATGINGDQTDNSASASGAVYVFLSLPTTLANISTRLRVETGDNVLIGGFIVTGPGSKRVLVRAIGPSLPLAGTLADPALELFGSGGLITSNDNWMDAPNQQEIIDSTIQPPNDSEAAILATLDPGAYTAIMRGVNDSSGIGLVEAYDLDGGSASELANISTRGLVQTGDNVLIGGFILVGPAAREVLVRAIGPSLPVAGALGDPTLDLFDGNGLLVVSNDDWRSDQEAEIMATTIPPTDDAESAILQTLAPAAYTAIVRGKNNTTGVALVEAYALTP